MIKQTIALASDHAGYNLRLGMKDLVVELGYPVLDLGPLKPDSVDYPDYANKMANAFLEDKCARGILICGTGIGISIAANRHAHLRAALCHDILTARLSRQHNDANVICLGERLIGLEAAKEAVKAFLLTEYEAGRHQKRVAKMS